jgi:cation:H+ antiporter
MFGLHHPLVAVGVTVGLTLPWMLATATRAGEMWLTATRSVLPLANRVNLRGGAGEALLALVLLRVALEFALVRGLVPPVVASDELLVVFTAAYLGAGTIVLVRWRAAVRRPAGTAWTTDRLASGRTETHAERAARTC